MLPARCRFARVTADTHVQIEVIVEDDQSIAEGAGIVSGVVHFETLSSVRSRAKRIKTLENEGGKLR